MSNPNYLPVRPNINNYASANVQNMVNRPVNKSINKPIGKPEQNIFSKSADPDVQQFINKKADVLSMEAVNTKEEATANTETIADDNGAKNKGTSWIIIILSVIIILLIMIIIYYVINYNNLVSGEVIPESVVKPTMHQLQGNDIVHKSLPNSGPIQMQPPVMMASVSMGVKKPRNYVEPSKQDLDDTLKKMSQLSKIEELPEEEIEEVGEKETGDENKFNTDDVDEEIDTTDEKFISNTMKDNTASSSTDEDGGDEDLMQKFIDQANN